jgi:hypothetical protein
MINRLKGAAGSRNLYPINVPATPAGIYSLDENGDSQPGFWALKDKFRLPDLLV